MFQVLEHLDRLDELFARLADVTRGVAHLFIAVPNDRRIAFNEAHGGLLDMPPNHVGRWNRRAFEIRAERHGWRLEGHKVEDEGAIAKARAHAEYVYFKGRQVPGSLANRVEPVRSRRLRRTLQAAVAGLYAAGALPDIAALVRGDGLGNSQWVHLRRAS
jgi:hypothetical protein